MMRNCLSVMALACALSGLAADPELTYVYPAGGRPESEFEIEVGGPVLQELVQAVVSGSGVKATLVGPARTIAYSKKGKPYPVAAQNRFRFKVVVEKDALPGVRSLRVGTAYRLSEPVRFEIGTLPEIIEAFTNSAVDTQAEVRELPVCLNGRVNGAGADRYRFQASKGMTLVAFTEARVLRYGSFRPALSFTDAAGKACEGVAVYDGDTAPVLAFDVPQDGVYILEVRTAAGIGGDACVYRVKLGELPLVTGFSPLGAKAGESLNVRLTGCNLPQQRVRLFTGGKNSALCLETLTANVLALPALRFDLGEEADIDEQDEDGGIQLLERPSVVNGVLDQAGGRDVYRFNGAAGEVVYVDARAEALGSPLWPVVTVRNSRGETVATGAFNTNNTAQTAMQGRDPSVRVSLAETGAYGVEVSDALGRVSESLRYRLRVGPPQPDFRLWMTPASLNIPSDGSALATIYLQRIHGFGGEVRVALDYPPLSIACEGGVIASNASLCKMTVSTEGVRFPRTVFGLSLTGTSQVDGRELKRPVLPFSFRDGRWSGGTVNADLSAKVGYGARALRVDQIAKTVVVDPRIPLPVAFKDPVPVNSREPLRLTILSATMATYLGGLYVPTVVWPPHGFTVSGVQPTNKQERAGVLLKTDAAVLRTGATGYFTLGCYLKSDTNKTVIAVTQSVPYVVK